MCAGISVNKYNMLSTSSNKIVFFCTLCTRFHLLQKLKMKFLQKAKIKKGLMKGLMQLKVSSQN